jgi:hypothetical protein
VVFRPKHQRNRPAGRGFQGLCYETLRIQRFFVSSGLTPDSPDGQDTIADGLGKASHSAAGRQNVPRMSRHPGPDLPDRRSRSDDPKV